MTLIQQINSLIRKTSDWLTRVVTHPRGELTRWQRAARFTYDLGRYGARQLRQDRAPQLAAALAYRTLFSLLPVLVVATVVFKATQGVEGVQSFIRRIAESMNLHELMIAGTGEQSESLADWLVVQSAKAADINFAAIGMVGLAVMIYSAISLMVTIEKSFNGIYRAPEGRSWLHRLPMYWTVLTLGGLGIALSFYIDTRFGVWINSLSSWHWVVTMFNWLWSFVATWLLLMIVYKLVPNARVEMRPVIIGAFVGAILIEVGKHLLNAYVGNALSFKQLYGSLGLVPLFMFWVYLMWLVVMFGLEVSATLQQLRGRRIEELERRQRDMFGLVDPARVVSVVETMAAMFGEGRAVTVTHVARSERIPEETARRILDRLVEAGVLHRVEGTETVAFSLARPAEQIEAGPLLELGYALADQGVKPHADSLLARLREAQRTTAAGLRLNRRLISDG